MVIHRNSKIALLYLLMGRIIAMMNLQTVRRPANHLRYSSTAYSSLFISNSKYSNGFREISPMKLEARKNSDEVSRVKASMVESPPEITTNQLSERVNSQPNFARQIFCNVELNCASLEAVGFDMDFTLAQVRGYLQ